jgi:hypothetical protein
MAHDTTCGKTYIPFIQLRSLTAAATPTSVHPQRGVIRQGHRPGVKRSRCSGCGWRTSAQRAARRAPSSRTTPAPTSPTAAAVMPGHLLSSLNRTRNRSVDWHDPQRGGGLRCGPLHCDVLAGLDGGLGLDRLLLAPVGDVDLAWLGTFSKRDRHGQHTVLIGRRDGRSVDALTQR